MLLVYKAFSRSIARFRRYQELGTVSLRCDNAEAGVVCKKNCCAVCGIFYYGNLEHVVLTSEVES